MAETNLHSDFDRKDFERYQSGAMSYAEQYRFERRLQDEPAFADAYEGFLLIQKNKVDLTKVAGELDRRLEERIVENKARLIPLWFYSAAAGLLISIGAGWLVFFSEKVVTPEAKNETRILKPEKATNDEVATRPASPKSEKLVGEAKELKGEDLLKRHTTTSNKEEGFVGQSSVPKLVAPVEEESESEVAETAQLPAEVRDKEVVKYKKSELIANQGELEVVTINAPQAAVARKSVRRSDKIKGRVVDESGQAIPGVSIRKSKNQIFATDSGGNFSIPATEGDSLSLAYIGYKDKNLLVGKDNFSAIVLEEDANSLSEVVVIGYGAQQKRSVTGGAKVEVEETKVKESPVPAAGWEVYTFYLRERTKSTSIKGDVVVSFTVNPDGSLSHFQARGKKSLRKLAIQIITDGPGWSPFKVNGIGIQRKAEVMVKFGGE